MNFTRPFVRLFQLTAARRRLVIAIALIQVHSAFQLTAARRRLVFELVSSHRHIWFQLTAARRPLVDDGTFVGVRNGVSTHSRPKAAGIVIAEVVAG